ncbi:MAG TPA: hypothetical protein VM889_05145 [Candidatus Thermoplasmatota archaeon]|nr:hypothetical protein [Candidatus Thermoplasmatota archaeon]
MNARSALPAALVALLLAAAPASAAGDEATRLSVSPPPNDGDRSEETGEDGNQTRVREPCANVVHDQTASGREFVVYAHGSFGFRWTHPATGALMVQVTPYWCLQGAAILPQASTPSLPLDPGALGSLDDPPTLP